MRWCSQRATEVGRKFGVLTRSMGSEWLPCPIAGDARIWASRVHLRTASHGSRAGSRWQTESSPTTGTPIIRLVLSGSTHFSYTRPGFYYGGLVERESLCFGLIQFFQHIYLFTHFPGVPRLAEFGNILGIRPFTAADSTSRTDDIEIGR
jgi:hypothetical protein